MERLPGYQGAVKYVISILRLPAGYDTAALHVFPGGNVSNRESTH